MQPGFHRAHRHAESDGSALVVETRPGAQLDNLAFVPGEPAHGSAYLGHLALPVDGRGHGIRMIIGRLVRRGDPRQGGVVSPGRPLRITQGVIGHAEQPGQGRLTVDHDLASPAPGLQEDG